MVMKKTNSGFLLILILLASSLNAQLPKFDEAEILKFSGEAKAVVLNRMETVKVKFSKGKPVIEVDHSEHIMFMSESSLAGQTFEVPYSDKFFPLESISACTYVKNEKGYTKVKALPPVHTSRVADGLFYDDMKQASVTFPSIDKYSVSELKYTYKILDPLYVFPFYFKPAESFPLIRSTFRIEYDQGFNIRILMFGDSSAVTTSSGQSGKYKWIERTTINQPAQKAIDNAPSSAYYKPHLFYLISSYVNKSNQIEYLGSVDQLYKQNYEYIKDFNSEACSKALKTVADSIRNVNLNSDSLDVIEDVLYWIQDHIRYIAIEDGLSGYIPRSSNSVFDKRYGDCKDMASLMQYMLKECGIVSNLAWIGTRDIPYTYEQLPLTQNSNHMILAKKINNEWHFFDPTSEGLRSFMPSSFIQGKEAMIAIDENHYEIAKVPEINQELNFITDTISGKLLNSGDFELSGKMTFGGLARWRIVAMYKAYDEKRRKDFIEAMIKHDYDKAEVIEYQTLNLDDRNLPFEITFKADFPDFAKVIEDNIYFNPHLRKPLMNEKIKDDRGLIPVEYMFKYTDAFHLEIQIPENTTISHLPEDVHFSTDLLDFNHDIKVDSGTISLNSEVIIKTIMFDEKDFGDWNQGVKELNKSFKESLVISPSK